jgi:hypothetical protein
VRSGRDEAVASRAGADSVVRTDGVTVDKVASAIRAFAPEGGAHVVEGAFDANIAADTELLAVGGSIAAYATGEPRPAVPFWELLFKNVRVFFLGSDDFPDLRGDLGLAKVPDHSTLCYAEQRLLKKGSSSSSSCPPPRPLPTAA